MTVSGREVSPKLLARMAGLFFLLTILAGIFAQGFVSERLIVADLLAALETPQNARPTQVQTLDRPILAHCLSPQEI